MKKIYSGIIISVLIIISFVGGSQAAWTTSNKYFGCVSKDYHDKLIGYAAANDITAFKKGLMAGVLTGQCILFKKGEEVFITDTSIFSGSVKIRKRGSTIEYWTNVEAVKE